MIMIEFYKHLSFNRLFWIFFIGNFLGVVVETIWCVLRNRKLESRKGLIYGPFNLVYGFGALIMTLSLSFMCGQRDLYVFVAGALIGGLYEYLCSIIQEKFLGSTSWNYKRLPLNLNGRINLLYCIFWGILALLWVKDLYPALSRLIDMIPDNYQTSLSVPCLIFIIYDSFISAAAVYRTSKRLKGEPPRTKFDTFLDKRYPTERVRKIYPNMVFESEKS